LKSQLLLLCVANEEPLVFKPRFLALHAVWIFGAKRGFTVVGPDYKTLGTTTIFPLFYRGYEQVIEFLEPILFPKDDERKLGAGLDS